MLTSAGMSASMIDWTMEVPPVFIRTIPFQVDVVKLVSRYFVPENKKKSDAIISN